MSVLQKISLVIVIIAALNWGLIGVFDFNIIAFLFDAVTMFIPRILYSITGVAGIISITLLFRENDRY